MKKNKYKVWFSTCNYEPEDVVVFAFDQEDALILAKAHRTKDGLDSTLNRIEAETQQQTLF